MSYVSIYESKMVLLSKFVFSVSMLLTILVALQFKSGKSGLFLKDKVHMSITNNLTNGIQLGYWISILTFWIIAETNIMILDFDPYILERLTHSLLGQAPY